MWRALSLLALAALLGAAAAPGAVVPGANGTARLALSATGEAWVAYVDGRDLLAVRPDIGTAPVRLARLPGPRATIAGFEVTRSGTPAVLAEDDDGRWLVLATQRGGLGRSVRLARSLAATSVLGRAGLTLDRAGRPAVAYAVRQRSQKTFLRLATGARLRELAVTRKGFPPSSVPPAAAPLLLPTGRLGVVETYAARGTATLFWRRTPDQWFGRFLFASALGVPVGPVFAEADRGTIHAAFTVDYPTLGERHVVLAQANGRARSTVLSRAGELAALAVGPDGPEVALNEPVADGLVAGVVARAGSDGVELDGRLVDLDVGGTQRNLLLETPSGGVDWLRSEGPLAVRVALSAQLTAGRLALRGRVEGAAGGEVQVYRERTGAPRALVAVVPLAPDGSFAAFDSPGEPSYYRAVYVQPATGIPFADLLRSPIG